MKLYGTYTSPFVRRVRAVAHLVDADYDLIDTHTDDGQAALRMASPIWLVPVLDNGEKAIFDSAVIVDYLIKRNGNRNVRTDSGAGRWREQNLITAIDGAVNSAINGFYLKRDGVTGEQSSYMQKQAARVESSMNWIEKQLDGPWFTDVERIGRAEIALLTTLEWMQFRDTYDPTRHPGFVDFLEAHRERPEFVTTRPPA